MLILIFIKPPHNVGYFSNQVTWTRNNSMARIRNSYKRCFNALQLQRLVKLFGFTHGSAVIGFARQKHGWSRYISGERNR